MPKVERPFTCPANARPGPDDDPCVYINLGWPRASHHLFFPSSPSTLKLPILNKQHTQKTSRQLLSNKPLQITMESVKQAANYVSETVQGAVSGASHEANKNVAKDSNVDVGTR